MSVADKKQENLIKYINDRKEFNREISYSDIREKLQNILFAEYLNKVRKGEVFDLESISREKKAYEREA